MLYVAVLGIYVLCKLSRKEDKALLIEGPASAVG